MPATDDWLTTFHPKPAARCRLVCFPHAGASASAFHPLSAAAPDHLQISAVQYPGRQWRRAEQSLTSVRDLAAGAVDAVRATAGAAVALYGHSMGAYVAFEAARLLEQRGEPVRRLFASGSNAPTRPRLRRPPHGWADAEILAELRSLGGTEDQVLTDEEALRMNLPALRADYRALLGYACPADARIDAPVTVVLGRADPTTTWPDVQRWREHTRSACDVAVVEGGHFFPAERPAEVMRVLRTRLDSILALRPPVARLDD